MAFLDFLTGKVKCPSCGTPGAKITPDGVKCTNPSCQWFDRSKGAPVSAPSTATSTASGGGFAPAASAAGDWASSSTLNIRYRNFKGEEKTFAANTASLVWNKKHLSVQVAPKGARIVLSLDRIQNLHEVEAAFPRPVAPGQEWPTRRERQVLNYHKRYKTTSALYEKTRAKYPNW